MKGWNLEEDRKLVDLHNKYNGSFKLIKQHFINKTDGALRNRYYRIGPEFKSGSWNPQEDMALAHWIFSEVMKDFESNPSVLSGKSKRDIEYRIKYFKRIIHDKLFSGLTHQEIEASKTDDINVNKRLKKEESKVNEENIVKNKLDISIKIEEVTKQAYKLIDEIKSES